MVIIIKFKYNENKEAIGVFIRTDEKLRKGWGKKINFNKLNQIRVRNK